MNYDNKILHFFLIAKFMDLSSFPPLYANISLKSTHKQCCAQFYLRLDIFICASSGSSEKLKLTGLWSGRRLWWREEKDETVGVVIMSSQSSLLFASTVYRAILHCLPYDLHGVKSLLWNESRRRMEWEMLFKLLQFAPLNVHASSYLPRAKREKVSTLPTEDNNKQTTPRVMDTYK